MNSKKDLKNLYKDMKFQIGVFQVRNTVNGKIFVGSSNNLEAIWNRIRAQLKFGAHLIPQLQKEWNEFGKDNFVFEILAEIDQKNDGNLKNYQTEAKQLENMFMEELQPFGELGYNIPKRK